MCAASRSACTELTCACDMRPSSNQGIAIPSCSRTFGFLEVSRTRIMGGTPLPREVHLSRLELYGLALQ